ncbi:unnamed protein product [Boreogadus saida]
MGNNMVFLNDQPEAEPGLQPGPEPGPETQPEDAAEDPVAPSTSAPSQNDKMMEEQQPARKTDEAVDYYNSHLSSLLDHHAPVKTNLHPPSSLVFRWAAEDEGSRASP